MKKLPRIALIGGFGLVFLSDVFAQGTFQNLDFEAVRNVPVFDPHNHPWLMPAADALPSWACYVGAGQVWFAVYNDLALDGASLGILTNASLGVPAGFVVGRYCVSLQYGVVATGPQGSVYDTVSIAQSGQLPATAQSIRLRGTGGLSVSFAGNIIPLALLTSQTGYGVYGGDISPFAGQTGELRFTSYTHFGYLDDIQFSAEPIPEPSALRFAVVGLLVLAGRFRPRLRRGEDGRRRFG